MDKEFDWLKGHRLSSIDAFSFAETEDLFGLLELAKKVRDQGYGRNINLEIIKSIESIVCQGEQPDLTIFLEISAEESILRRKNFIPDRIDY